VVTADEVRSYAQAGLGAAGTVYTPEGEHQRLRRSILSMLGARWGNEVREKVGRWVIRRSMHADAASRAALLVDLRLRGNHDAYENGDTVHVRISAEEQRKKVQCSKYNFSGPVLRRCDIWASTGPGRFRAGRFHTQFLGIEHVWLVEIGCR
jgi:hypothetical protein